MSTRAARILVVEDEPALVETISYNLSREGYEVRSERDGIAGLRSALADAPDIIILDLMLPGMGGLDVCRQLRRTSTVPILMLTALNDEVDKVVGLEMGADDYVTKPFSMRELIARVKALLRRTPTTPLVTAQQSLQFGPFALDEARHEIRRHGTPLTLTPLEYNLLEFLLRNHGATFSRETLLEKVWGYDYAGDSRTVDVHVRSLREKIEDTPGAPRRIMTVRGVGYRLDLD